MMIGERSLPLRSAKRCSYGLLLLGAGVFGTPVAADPLEDYRQACKAPLYDILSEIPYPDLAESRALGDASWAAAERSCAAFRRGLAAAEPSAEVRLALYLARRMLGEVRYDDPEACAEIEEIAKVLPAHADALVALAVCTHATEEYMPLLQKALEINPSHHDALVYVTTMATHTGDYYGTDPSTLASHGEALYEATGYVNDRFLAAKAIYKAAKDVGDFAAKESIRVRLRRDLGLDALDYSPARRDGSLQRACADQLFELGLEEPCVSTLVAFASEAVTTGTPIPGGCAGTRGLRVREPRTRIVGCGKAESASGRFSGVSTVVGAPSCAREERRRPGGPHGFVAPGRRSGPGESPGTVRPSRRAGRNHRRAGRGEVSLSGSHDGFRRPV